MEILRWKNVGSNLLRYALTLAPVVVIIALNGRRLAARLERRGLLTIVIAAVASAGVYLAIHLPLDNEYKLLLISMGMLGILGGLAFDSMLERYGRSAVLVLIILFVLPALRVSWLRTIRGRDIPSTYVERGMIIESLDRHDNELYRWIRIHTAPSSIFIDSGLEVPVLGQRQILIPPPAQGRQQQKGFGLIKIILTAQSGYESDLVNGRTEIVDRIYGPSNRLRADDIETLRTLAVDVYAIARTAVTADKLEAAGFKGVFASSDGSRRVFLLPHARSSTSQAEQMIPVR
jgi:hypothetical protein